MAVKDMSSEELSIRLDLACGQDPRELSRLANDPNCIVRLLVYINPDTPEAAREATGIESDDVFYELYYTSSYAYDYDDDEWLYHVADCDPDGFKANAVVLNDKDSYEEADWWVNTVDFVDSLDFSDTLDDFLSRYSGHLGVKEEYGFDEFDGEEWENVLTELYNIHKQSPSGGIESVYEVMIAEAKLLNPHIKFKQFTITNPYHEEEYAIFLYDADAFDYMYPDEVRSWYFWDIYEARYDCLCAFNLKDASMDEFEGASICDIFTDFGDGGDGPALVQGPELREHEANNTMLGYLAEELSVPVEYSTFE